MITNFDDCAILILSCDKNELLLKIFFDFFKKNWNDCPFERYVGLEYKDLYFEGVRVLKSNQNSFCSRLKEYLKVINKKYVLIILDDFILEEKVNNTEIQKYYNILTSDDSASNLTLAWIDGKESIYKDNVMKKAWDSNFLVNLQVSFWRTECLQDILKEGENAWEAELLGSIRARKYKNNRLFLHLSSDDEMPYKYNRGWLMVKGCWNGNEIKRLGLYDYAKYFIDGRKIIYDNFGKSSKLNSAKIRFRVLFHKILSCFNIY